MFTWKARKKLLPVTYSLTQPIYPFYIRFRLMQGIKKVEKWEKQSARSKQMCFVPFFAIFVVSFIFGYFLLSGLSELVPRHGRICRGYACTRLHNFNRLRLLLWRLAAATCQSWNSPVHKLRPETNFNSISKQPTATTAADNRHLASSVCLTPPSHLIARARTVSATGNSSLIYLQVHADSSHNQSIGARGQWAWHGVD